MSVSVASLGTKNNAGGGGAIQFSYADGLRGSVGEWIIFAWTSGITYYPKAATLVASGLSYPAYLTVDRFYGVDTSYKAAFGMVRVPVALNAGDYISLELDGSTTQLASFYRVGNAGSWKPVPYYNGYCDITYSLHGAGGGNSRIGSLYYCVGGTITSINLRLQRVGSPTGTAFVSIRDYRDDSILGIIQNIDVSTITTGIANYTFNLSPVSIASPRPVRILIEYTGGDASNYVKVHAQSQADPTGNGDGWTASYYSSGAYSDFRNYQNHRPSVFMEVSGGYCLYARMVSGAVETGKTDSDFAATGLGTDIVAGYLAIGFLALEAPSTDASGSWESDSADDISANRQRITTGGAIPERVVDSVTLIAPSDGASVRAHWTGAVSRKGYIQVRVFVEGSGTPSQSPSISPSASISPSSSRSPSASVSPSISKSASESPTISQSASRSKSASVSPTPSQSASISPSASASPSPLISVDDVTLRFVASASLSPSASLSHSASISPSASRSHSASLSPSASPSPSPIDFEVPPPACNINTRQHVVLKDQNGNRVALFDSFIRLEYEKRVNDVGYFAIEFYDEPCDDRFDLFELDGQVEVWRTIPGADVDWYREYEGLFRKPRREIGSDGRRRFIASGVGYNHLLARRVIAYKQATTYATKNDYLEDVMKDYVNENAGPGAGAPSRIGPGIFPNFTVEPLVGYVSVSWRGDRSFNSLLDVLQEISNYSLANPFVGLRAIDFAVVSNGDGAFIFRTYPNQLGSDRTEDSGTAVPVIFSVELGNMQELSHELDRTAEATRAIVLGEGELSTREVIYREDITASDDSPWNVIEVARPASLNEFDYQLQDFGDSLLKELSKKEIFEGIPIQTPSTLYGLHYFLGDIVTVRYMGTSYDKKIVAVKIAYEEEGRETVSIEWEDVTR